MLIMVLPTDSMISILLRVPRALTLKRARSCCRQLLQLISSEAFQLAWMQARRCFLAQEVATLRRRLMRSADFSGDECDACAALIDELRFETIAEPEAEQEDSSARRLECFGARGRLPPLSRAMPPVFEAHFDGPPVHEIEDQQAMGIVPICEPSATHTVCTSVRISVGDGAAADGRWMLASWSTLAYFFEDDDDGDVPPRSFQLHAFRKAPPYQSHLQDVCCVTDNSVGCYFDYIDLESNSRAACSGVEQLRLVLGPESAASRLSTAKLLTTLACASAEWLELGLPPCRNYDEYASIAARLSEKLSTIAPNGGGPRALAWRKENLAFDRPAFLGVGWVSPGCWLLGFDTEVMPGEVRYEMRRRITKGAMLWLENDWPSEEEEAEEESEEEEEESEEGEAGEEGDEGDEGEEDGDDA